MSQEEILSQNLPKRKPLLFSVGNYPVVIDLDISQPEIDGFREKQQHDELVSHMLDNCVSKIVSDIRSNPPQRKYL